MLWLQVQWTIAAALHVGWDRLCTLEKSACRRVRAGHDSTWVKTFGCLTDASNRTCAEVHMPGTVQLSQDVRLKMMASVATTSFKAFCFSLSDRDGSLTLVNKNGSGKRADGQLQGWNLLQGIDLVVRQPENLSTPQTVHLVAVGRREHLVNGGISSFTKQRKPQSPPDVESGCRAPPSPHCQEAA